MKKHLTRSLLCLLILFEIIATGCTRNVVGGNPTIPLANTNGTTHVFDVGAHQVEQALTNAFEPATYHEMPFIRITNSDWDYLSTNWHPTNGYILYSGDPIASIPLDTGIVVPYIATFYITLQSQDDMKHTKLTVRTMQALVIDGQEQGVHGGQVNHGRQIAPVRQGEENVLEAIAKEVNATNRNF